MTTANRRNQLEPRDWQQKIAAAHALAESCCLCPRRCGARRHHGERGRCLAGIRPMLARACLHRGEEPVLDAGAGVGNLFFGGCQLRCVYCQNHSISQPARAHREKFERVVLAPDRPGVDLLASWELDVADLAEQMVQLQSQGAASIGLVSPTPHLPGVLEALQQASENGLTLPVIHNGSGYEGTETLELLDGIVDIYLPDLKYATRRVAGRLSAAPDYPDHAFEAVTRMHQQVGRLHVNAQGRAQSGLLVRHLVLPGHLSESLQVLRRLVAALGNDIALSLLAQYHPTHRAAQIAPLGRGLREHEYRRVVDEMDRLGLDQGFTQDLESAGHYLPDFGAGGHPFEAPRRIRAGTRTRR